MMRVDSKAQAGRVQLTANQRQLLQHFNQMSSDEQQVVLGMVCSIAAGCAARTARPALRLVAGGAA